MRKYDLFIGIDISKNWIDVSLTCDGVKKQMPHIRVDNTEAGFAKLLKWMRSTALYVRDKNRWLCCMEHTGVYTLRLCRFLEQKRIAYVLVDLLHLKYSLGLRRGKNDKEDSAHIARFIFMHHDELELSEIISDKLLILKNLLSLRKRLVKSRAALNTASKELQAFEKKVITQQVVPISQKQAKQLHQSIKQIEKRMLQLIRSDEELDRLYDLVTSVKGANLIIATALLVFTVGFKAFTDPRKFAVYIGLVPFEWKSGESLNVPAKVSHLAHKTIKGYISNGASSAMQHDKELKAYYQRRLAQGKNKYVVQNAIRNKFLYRIFAVVKRGTPYVEFGTFRS
mgnify:CR=1 FL=1